MEEILLIKISVQDLKDLIAECIKEHLTVDPPKEEKLIKVDAVCKILGISKVTTINWRKQGKIQAYKLGRRVYFKESEVMEAVKKL